MLIGFTVENIRKADALDAVGDVRVAKFIEAKNREKNEKKHIFILLQ